MSTSTRAQRGARTPARSGRLDRQLAAQLEVFEPVGEGPTVPGLEGGLFVRHEAAVRQPGSEEPVERAQFELDVAAQLDLGHAHGRELEAADFTLGTDSVDLDLDRDVVAAVLQGHDAGRQDKLRSSQIALSRCESDHVEL
jgi:hypothetical protein